MFFYFMRSECRGCGRPSPGRRRPARLAATASRARRPSRLSGVAPGCAVSPPKTADDRSAPALSSARPMAPEPASGPEGAGRELGHNFANIVIDALTECRHYATCLRVLHEQNACVSRFHAHAQRMQRLVADDRPERDGRLQLPCHQLHVRRIALVLSRESSPRPACSKCSQLW